MQKPQQIKIIFFDIDHTLYQTDLGIIPPSITEQVIPRLKANGIIPAIASGRCLGAFPAALKDLIEQGMFELFVTVNGQHNSYKNSLISQYPLATSRVEQIIEKFKLLNIDYAFVTRDEIAVSNTNEQIHHALVPIKANYIVDPQYYLTNDVIQMLAFFPEERFIEVQASGVLGEDLKEVRWHPYSVDVLNKQNSKARGISDVLSYLDLTAENAMAFGDGLNDLEMLQSVGFGVAMGNAHEKLKALADYVTDRIEEDGILKALEKLDII